MTIHDRLEQDSTIYHYTQAEIALEHILPFARLKLSLLANTGDPREYKFWFFGASGWGRFPPDFDHKFSKAHTIIDTIRRQEFRMASFCLNQSPSESETDIRWLGCVRSRMWAQYGDGHRGVCLALDKNAFDKTIRQESEIEAFSGPIEYNLSKMWDARQLDVDEIRRMGLEEYCHQHVLKRYDSFFLKKDPDYKDEVEHRVLVWDPDQKLEYVSIKDSLIAILIGDRFPDGYLPSIYHFCKILRVGCRRVYWSMSSEEPALLYCAPIDNQLRDTWEDFPIPDPT